MKIQYPSETIKAITEFLFIEKNISELMPSNLVLVLGNDFIDGTAKEILRLYQAKIITSDAKVILSGATGSLNAGKQAECDRLYTSITEKFHMPHELLIKERQATNAYQNFLYSKQIVQELGGFSCFSKILCIGKAFLLRRASMYAAKLEYPVEKMQYFGTVDSEGRNIGKDTWWKNEAAIERVLAEIKRIGEYGLKGDLSVF